MTAPAIPEPDRTQLTRGRDLGDRLHAIAAEISAWADEVDAGNAERSLRVQTYSHRVLAQLQSARTDLGTLTMAMAERGDSR